MLEFLHILGLTERTPFAFERIPPLGMPAVFSLALWGGVWGVAFANVELLLTDTVNYWLFALLFGAIAPSIVNWFVSAPLHGFPLGSGWHLPEMVTSILVNGAWGVGTALLLRLWFRRHAEWS